MIWSREARLLASAVTFFAFAFAGPYFNTPVGPSLLVAAVASVLVYVAVP